MTGIFKVRQGKFVKENDEWTTREDVVAEFHTAFGSAKDKPFDGDLIALRMSLLSEEFDELSDEMATALVDFNLYGEVKKKTKVRLLKELADLQYVLSGLAVTFGLPLEEAFSRVHQSNMSKLGEDGKPIYRDDGKVLKGPNYRVADLEDLFKE